MKSTILTRVGLESDSPTLKLGELGFTKDKKVLVIGDDTPTPPKMLTDKTEGTFDLTGVHLLLSSETMQQLSVPGPNGWTPHFGTEEREDGRFLIKIIGYTGGEGEMPDGVGSYLRANGEPTPNHNLATDFRGPSGQNGPTVTAITVVDGDEETYTLRFVFDSIPAIDVVIPTGIPANTVMGPVESVDGNIAVFDGEDGNKVRDSEITLDALSDTITKANSAIQSADLATVATSGAYNDLSGKPTLGTAAAVNTGASAGNVPVLDGSGKIPTEMLPEMLVGAMAYQGTWNASTNTPSIAAASSANNGHYYIVSTAGTTSVNGVNDWQVGDWIVSNGTTWAKIDSSDQVNSVAGLQGTITDANLRTALNVLTAAQTDSAADARIAAALGISVQAYHANLAALAGLVGAANQLAYFTGAGALSLTSLTTYARNLLGIGSAATAQNHLELVPGTHVVAYNAGIVPVVGRQSIPISASSLKAYSVGTPADGDFQTVTSGTILVKDFDTSAEEFATFEIRLPKQWNRGTITFDVGWTYTSSGTGGVAWGLSAAAVSNDDGLNVTWGTEVIVTDTVILHQDYHVTAESTAVTVGGSPAVNDLIRFKIARKVANASDTLAQDARLIDINIYITTAAGTDA